jgi:phage terminase large subunit-like protein
LDFLPDLPVTERGEAAWDVFARFKLTEGVHSGKRLGEHAAPWQQRLVELVYGVEDDGGNRLYNEVLLLVARKAGKSAMASIWTLAHILIAPEDRGQVILLADNQKQAGICLRNIVALVNSDAYLKRRFKIKEHLYQVQDKETGTLLYAASSELSNLIGAGPSCGLIDELHLIGSRPKGEQLVRAISTGQLARQDPLLIYTTTQSMGTPAGIFASTLARARRVQAGDAPEDDRFLPVLFEPPEGTKPEDKHYWWMANPSAGVTFDMARLQKDYEVAANDPDPTKLAVFASQHCNIPGNSGALGYDKWIPGYAVRDATDESLTLDSMLAQCNLFWIAVDRGGSDDLEAVCIIGTPDGGQEQKRSWMYWGQQYVTQQGYERSKKYLPLDEHIASGELLLLRSGSEDLLRIESLVERCKAAGGVAALGYDMHNKGPLEELAERQGVYAHEVPQGWRIHAGMVWVERTMLDEAITFTPNKMLEWNLDHAVVKWSGNSKMLSKELSQSKIDGAVAFAMGGYLIGQRINANGWVPFNAEALIG